MFATVLALIFTGFPVAFVLGGVTLLFMGLGMAIGEFNFIFMQALPQRVFGLMQNFTILAVPFFIFMGMVLERARLAEDLLSTAGMLFGKMRGGVAIGVVVIGTLLAASTGVIGATVVAMGLISLPVMLRYKYQNTLATGVIAAAGSLGQIVPPSIVLIVLGDQLGVSVGDLFMGAMLPGLMLAGLYVLYIAGYAMLRPDLAPALPPEELDAFRGRALGLRVLRVLVPPLVLIVAVLGSIFAGIATPTEAGAVGAVGAMLLAALNGRMSWGLLREAVRTTGMLTSMVMLILVGATAFALVFRGLDGDWLMRDLLTSLPGEVVGFLIFSMVLVFILGFFIDFFEIVFIVVPILLPAAMFLQVDLVWYGILIALVIQTSFLTPPFGFALFYLRGVTPPEITTVEIYRGVVPFIAIQVFAVVVVFMYPQLVLWLPSLR
ncbi:MAG: TRAP transporter large permease subunit [Rhodobacteraceae bacterium]|nr:TRAP transporter large permease subunit [Paracoccaceae bacterium]